MEDFIVESVEEIAAKEKEVERLKGWDPRVNMKAFNSRIVKQDILDRTESISAADLENKKQSRKPSSSFILQSC